MNPSSANFKSIDIAYALWVFALGLYVFSLLTDLQENKLLESSPAS